MRTVLDQTSENEIRDLLVGRRIVSAEMGTFDYPNRQWHDKASGRLTLDDGTNVYIVPNIGGCSCSAGDYELTSLAKVDNIITAVRLAADTEEDKWGEAPITYRIYVVADAVEVNAVQIDGDDGNGYYGTGYELVVAPVEEDTK